MGGFNDLNLDLLLICNLFTSCQPLLNLQPPINHQPLVSQDHHFLRMEVAALFCVQEATVPGQAVPQLCGPSPAGESGASTSLDLRFYWS